MRRPTPAVAFDLRLSVGLQYFLFGFEDHGYPHATTQYSPLCWRALYFVFICNYTLVSLLQPTRIRRSTRLTRSRCAARPIRSQRTTSVDEANSLSVRDEASSLPAHDAANSLSAQYKANSLLPLCSRCR